MKKLQARNAELFNAFKAVSLNEKELAEVNGGAIPVLIMVGGVSAAFGFTTGLILGIAKWLK